MFSDSLHMKVAVLRFMFLFMSMIMLFIDLNIQVFTFDSGLIFKLLVMVVTCTRLFFQSLGGAIEHFLLNHHVTYIGRIDLLRKFLFEVLLLHLDDIILFHMT